MNENDNHPLTNGTYGDLNEAHDAIDRAYQMTVEAPDPNEYLNEQIVALHQLCENGESDCPWATWEECLSFDLAAILGVRLQTLCHNRRRFNHHGD